MARRISATEAKAKLSSLIKWAVENKDEVVVESRGTPKAAILSYEAYEQYQDLREQARRRQLLAQLETLADQIQSRNQELSESAADELAGGFTREVIAEMVEEGKVKYRRD